MNGLGTTEHERDKMNGSGNSKMTREERKKKWLERLTYDELLGIVLGGTWSGMFLHFFTFPLLPQTNTPKQKAIRIPTRATNVKGVEVHSWNATIVHVHIIVAVWIRLCMGIGRLMGCGCVRTVRSYELGAMMGQKWVEWG